MRKELLSEYKSLCARLLELLRYEVAKYRWTRHLADAATVLEPTFKELGRKLGRALSRGRGISPALQKLLRYVNETVRKTLGIAHGLRQKALARGFDDTNLRSICDLASKLENTLPPINVVQPLAAYPAPEQDIVSPPTTAT